MEKFVDLDIAEDAIGIPALRRIKTDGVKRHQLGIVLESPQEDEDQSICRPIEQDGYLVGFMTY